MGQPGFYGNTFNTYILIQEKKQINNRRDKNPSPKISILEFD